ncbi:hypothetical protein NVV44_00815 [Enterobacter cloacae]|uniref:hypothetical protein n=1 Tax=Enterobacter cloacae complex TaxID=354276 RepID=UPI002147844A|nr:MULTISPECIES: hypothetical protein [Enterobacter cloacae complex]MCR6728196.1 hypothetical protein [Enterobacter cloacae]UUR79318.1 hypothetical protein NQ842_11380 [Enterobacter cloacae complex sp. R_G8]
MKLYDFCFSTYENDERWLNNGFSCKRQSIVTMLNTIYRSLTSGVKNPQGLPKIGQLLDMELSASGEFRASYLPDLVAVAFDVMTEINRNPLLWGSIADSENQAKHTFVVLFHGPHGEVIQNNQGAANGERYEKVKAQLINDIDASYNHLNF